MIIPSPRDAHRRRPQPVCRVLAPHRSADHDAGGQWAVRRPSRSPKTSSASCRRRSAGRRSAARHGCPGSRRWPTSRPLPPARGGSPGARPAARAPPGARRRARRACRQRWLGRWRRGSGQGVGRLVEPTKRRRVGLELWPSVNGPACPGCVRHGSRRSSASTALVLTGTAGRPVPASRSAPCAAAHSASRPGWRRRRRG
jgi:hypothetical protein